MYRSLSLALTLALASLGLAACGTTEASPAKTESSAAPKATPTSTDAQAACVQLFTRNRECTADYIPALVDLRARLDKPAGIAEKVKADRAAIIAQANEEWATDSTDDAIAATCAKVTANLSDADLADAEGIKACMAETSCAAHTACVMPFFEKRFTK
jgi:hypothetical protein